MLRLRKTHRCATVIVLATASVVAQEPVSDRTRPSPPDSLAALEEFQTSETLQGISEAWDLAQKLDFNGAMGIIESLPGRDDPAMRRHLEFSEALLLLNVQPLTQENIARAKAIFDSLRSGEIRDPLQRMAWYHYTRILEWHQDPIQFDAAYQSYLNLYQQNPDDFVCQLAMFRAGVMDIMGRYYPSTDTLSERLDYWSEVASTLSFPGPRRNLYNTIGDSIAIHDLGPERALQAYRRAAEAGYTRWDFQMLGVIREFMWSERAGQTEDAIKAMELFLDRYSFTPYAFYVEQKLKDAKQRLEQDL